MLDMDKEGVLIVINIVLSVAGFVVSFMLSRLMSVIKKLEERDKELERKIENHREDVLKNYVTAEDLVSVKHDIIDRIDRAEKTFLSVAGRRESDRS